MLAKVLGLSEAQLLARTGESVAPAAATAFRDLLLRRLAGEPVAYLLGEREFFGRPFSVDRRVLIPRPETEHLVEEVLRLPLPEAPSILDLCTGSGAIAVTLALELPRARLVAGDISPAALAVAARNVRRHRGSGAGRVALVGLDLAHGLDLAPFDVVVCNPPYVDPGEAPRLSPEVVDFEPHAALFAPGAGDTVIARLLHEAVCLRRGAHLLIEIGHDQLERARRHAADSAFELVAVRDDYAGIPRVLRLRRR